MVPLTVNPTVRVYTTPQGTILGAATNIDPDLKLEVVQVRTQQTIEQVEQTIEGTRPYKVKDVEVMN